MNTKPIIEFITGGWKEMLGTKRDFERHQTIQDKKETDFVIEQGSERHFCPKCGDEVLG